MRCSLIRGGCQPEFDGLSDVAARLVTGGAPGVAALQRRDVDVEPTVLIGLEDYFDSLNELTLGHGGFIITAMRPPRRLSPQDPGDGFLPSCAPSEERAAISDSAALKT